MSKKYIVFSVLILINLKYHDIPISELRLSAHLRKSHHLPLVSNKKFRTIKLFIKVLLLRV